MSANAIFSVVFILFLGILLLGGIISRRWVKESSDFILAGREVSTLINTMGVCAIGYAGTSIALSPGFSILMGFRTSMTFALIYCGLGLALFGILYAGFIRRCGAQTLPEYLEMRYGPKVRSVVSITSIVGMCGILANNIVSCVQSVVGYTGWNATLVLAVVFFIIIAFIFISGLWAATINDFVQVVIGAIAIPTLFFLLIGRFGGFEVLFRNWPAGGDWVNAGLSGLKLPGFSFLYPSVLNFVVCFAAALVWGNNYYWMKVASCRNEKVARKSFILAAIILVVVFMGPLGIIGSYTGASYSSSFVQLGGKVAHVAAYGFISATFAPLLGALFIIGAVAASISTASTSALGASAVATRDIYQRLINPGSDTKKTLKASKIAMVLIGVITFLLCQFPGGPTYLFAFANCWLVPPAIMLGLGALWPRFGKRGAIVGGLAGMITMVLFTILSLARIFDINAYIYLASLGFIVTLVVAIIATLTEPPAYFAAPGWERVPTVSNRKDIALDDFDLQVLKLISVGHLYLADLTDAMGVDSRTSSASIEKLDQGGYIVRRGLNRSAFYTFDITDKGLAALPILSGSEAEMRNEKLTPIYVDLLTILKNNPDEQMQFINKYQVKSMHMAAISSHLARQGYIVEGALFKRKLRLTEKGIAAVTKYALK
jgi:SSS family solute:Na+ symporter